MKCDCGDRPHGKEDCAHLEKGDSKREHDNEYNDTGSDHRQWIITSAVAATVVDVLVP